MAEMFCTNWRIIFVWNGGFLLQSLAKKNDFLNMNL